MGYRLLTLQSLLSLEQTIRDEYLAKVRIQNPARIQLLDTLNALINAVRASNNLTEEEAQQICTGAYIFALERVADEYRALNPEFKEGYLWNSGSKLYQTILRKLDINPNNLLDDKDKLIYLSKLYRYLHDARFEAAVAEAVRAKNLDLIDIQGRLRAAIKSVFQLNKADVGKIIKAIPAESALDARMNNMVERYVGDTTSDNADRKMHAQFIQSLAQVIPHDPREDDHKHFLSRRQRVKMGFLLYVMRLIWDSYYIRSPKGNSALYDLSRDALNIDAMKDMDGQTRLACLTAFETFITDSQNVASLESKLGQVYVDPAIHMIRKKLDVMIEDIHVSIPASSLVSSFALTSAALGAMIASAPGYGSGYVIGYTLSQINEMVGPKLAITKLTDYSLTLILGGAGNYLGYYASTMVVDATLERAFAKVFEALGMLAGAAVGGVVGLVIYDLSYQTLKNLCTLYFDLHAKLQPTLAKDIDQKYIECLLALPEDIFADEKKDKVRAVTHVGQVGLFRQAAPAEVREDNPVVNSQREDALLVLNRN